MPLRFFRWRHEHLDEISRIEKMSFTLPWSQEALLEVIASEAFDAIVGVDEQNVIVGYVVFCEVLDELQILNVAIHPDHRKKRYGHDMLSYVHRQAFARGRKESFLEVRESNEPAIALYKSFGYQAYTRRPKYYSDTNEDAILMRAILKP